MSMTLLRHKNFHPQITQNLKDSNDDLRGIEDDVLYWMFESWNISTDYPDESYIIQHQQTANEDMIRRYQYYTDQMIYGNDAYIRSIQEWEMRYYGEVKTHG